MRRVHLVTHPESQHHVDGLVGGWFDSELTARGEADAERIAEALEDRIDDHEVAVHSSDLKRAQHTAVRIARRFSVEVRTDERLRERCYGEAEGRPQAWLDTRRVPLPEHGDRLGHHDGPAGTETRLQLVQRIYPALEDILDNPVTEQVIVSHGSASSVLIMAWLGIPMLSTDRGFFPLTSGSITTLVQNDTHFSHNVVELNDTRHLGVTDHRRDDADPRN